jgi:chemotaxis protein MotB
LPNRISISGHTSANAGGGGVKADGDWPLSQGRAEAARKILQSSGVDADRVFGVTGRATAEPLYPDDPTLPGNRRIAIVLLREAPVLPPDRGP